MRDDHPGKYGFRIAQGGQGILVRYASMLTGRTGHSSSKITGMIPDLPAEGLETASPAASVSIAFTAGTVMISKSSRSLTARSLPRTDPASSG